MNLLNLALGVMLILYGRHTGWREAMGIILLLLAGVIQLKKEWS